jgi:putative addiction module killer protein
MYPYGYTEAVYQLKETDHFSKWLSKIRDMRALARIFTGLENLRQGNFGDAKSLKGGLYELRIHTGKGYRLYCTKRRNQVIFLLAGGTKSSQVRDIEKAREILSELRS